MLFIFVDYMGKRSPILISVELKKEKKSTPTNPLPTYIFVHPTPPTSLTLWNSQTFYHSISIGKSFNEAEMEYDGVLLGMGNPLLDISAIVDQEFIDK